RGPGAGRSPQVPRGRAKCPDPEPLGARRGARADVERPSLEDPPAHRPRAWLCQSVHHRGRRSGQRRDVTGNERRGGQNVRLTPDIERTLRRYALGGLEEELRPELEELLITDSDAFEALGVIEDELIEDYLEETGSPAERRSLERHLLSRPDGLRRLRLARALRERASLPVTSPAKETSP